MSAQPHSPVIFICDSGAHGSGSLHQMIGDYLKVRNTDALIVDSANELQFRRNVSAYGIPDIAFLEIRIPEINGIQIARKLRKKSQKTIIIFTSGTNEYAEEAFDVDALYYLQKPLKYEKLQKVMDKAGKCISMSRFIKVISNRETMRISIDSIKSIETLNRRLIIHTAYGDVGTYVPMASIMAELPEDEFLRISRFEAVGTEWIASCTEREILMKDGKKLRISEKLSDKVMDAYEAYHITALRMTGKHQGKTVYPDSSSGVAVNP